MSIDFPASERQAARERCERATDGPWEVGGPWPAVSVIVMVDGVCGGECPEPPRYEPVFMVHNYDPETMLPVHPPRQSIQDAEFCAHSRTDLPRALDALDAAEKRIGELEAAVRAMADVWPVQRRAVLLNIHEKHPVIGQLTVSPLKGESK